MNEDKITMALNPYSKKLMNVEPFFNFWFTFENDVIARIDGIIRTIITSDILDSENFMAADPYMNNREFFDFIYRLKDMFERLSECEISMPTKKGGVA